MASTDPSSSKRRKKTHNAPLAAGNIANLPSEPLIHIASYLAAPSRALFAVAVATSNLGAESSQDSISTAIVGYHWDSLDFGQIEKELAAKLSDEDISAVLQCIDAANTVKRLRLTNCVNITGSCLEPIRHSRNVEVIDLSLVGDHESPVLHIEPLLSLDVVLPILDSILLMRGVKLIQFPKAWRQQRSDEFYYFLRRYSDIWWNRRETFCEKCDINIHSIYTFWVNMYEGKKCGVLNHTCHGCLSHYCPRCEKGELTLKFCSSCERSYCFDCSKIDACNSCHQCYCHDCTSFGGCCGEGCEEKQFCGDCQLKCEICNETSCKNCCIVRNSDNSYACFLDCITCKRTLCVNCVGSPSCEMCQNTFCGDCNDKEGDGGVIYCEECGDKGLCIGCRYKDFKKNGSKCSECFGIIGAAFDHVKGLYEIETQRQNK